MPSARNHRPVSAGIASGMAERLADRTENRQTFQSPHARSPPRAASADSGRSPVIHPTNDSLPNRPPRAVTPPLRGPHRQTPHIVEQTFEGMSSGQTAGG